jgi:hypothetical protein
MVKNLNAISHFASLTVVGTDVGAELHLSRGCSSFHAHVDRRDGEQGVPARELFFRGAGLSNSSW